MRGSPLPGRTPANYSLPHAAWEQFAAEAGPTLREFELAIRAPRAAQLQRLQAILEASAGTHFGRQHDFASIDSPAEFQRRVPVACWPDVAPWVNRAKTGQSGVLTAEDAVHFERTSGSGSASKDIPYTPALLREFQRALVVSLATLHRDCPGVAGPGYWSLSPDHAPPEFTPGGITMGSAGDALYVADSPLEQLLPSIVGTAGEHAAGQDWQLHTLAMLAAEPELRLLSVWSPSFLQSLLAAVLDPERSDESLAMLCPLIPTARFRALALAVARRDFTALWPRLEAISCWTDGPSAVFAAQLGSQFPGARILPKGLFATEGVVSTTWGCAPDRPVAITSHFLEFLDDAGEPRLVDELQTGRCYRPLLTTSGGLYRYRLGDVVEVTGFLDATASIRFVGREDHRSDLVGEKLDESMVARALREAGMTGPAMLVPDAGAQPPRYVLVSEGLDAPRVAAVECQLNKVHHYRIARVNDQLGALQAGRAGNLAQLLHAAWQADGRRSGDAKPAALVASARLATQMIRLLQLHDTQAVA